MLPWVGQPEPWALAADHGDMDNNGAIHEFILFHMTRAMT